MGNVIGNYLILYARLKKTNAGVLKKKTLWRPKLGREFFRSSSMTEITLLRVCFATWCVFIGGGVLIFAQYVVQSQSC